jgi:2-hydroxychromene-2-carboxylate isomerase
MTPFEHLRGDAALAVYIDLKSPYAFLAIDPIRAVAQAAGVAVDWRPFTLDIPSYLGSARLDKGGRLVESRRTESQWSSVRHAYRDARRYARLRGRILRGTEKIWDSSLAGIGLLWAKRQGSGVVDRYLDRAYDRFWQRDLDIEDPAVIEAVLAEAGAAAEGFPGFSAGSGRREHDTLNEAAFAAGIFGVPTCLVGDEMWFGREHLPRVAWWLGGRHGPAPDIAYEDPVPGAVDAVFAQDPHARAGLRVAVDIRHPQAWLAWDPTRRLMRELGLAVTWLPFEAPPPERPAEPAADAPRGIRHRYYRSRQLEREFRCYAAAQGLDAAGLYRPGTARAAHAGLLWASRHDAGAVEPYLDAVLRGWWSRHLDGDDPGAVADILESCGVQASGFPEWAAHEAHATLDTIRRELAEAGVLQVPAYVLGGEAFHGRQHLPVLRRLLVRQQGLAAPPPGFESPPLRRV